MVSKAKLSRWFMTTAIVAVLGLAGAREASAQSCVNDDDCPVATCGGQVCDWITKGLTCQPAGNATKGQDGWCTTTEDCKCKGLGATCVGTFCTFTLPSQAPGAAATGGASGSTGGASGSTGGASGSAGASGSGGAAATGGSSGSDAGTKPKDDGGGCTVAGSSSGAGGLASLLGMAALGVIIAFRRRGVRR